MTRLNYLMEAADEPERIRAKTQRLVTSHHLAWAALGRDESFADIGCATGDVLYAASKLTDALCVGIDQSEQMLAEARDLCGDRVRFVQSRVAGPGSIAMADDSVDHAWSRFFLEYAPDPVAVIREMTRIVRPGGRVTLIDIDGNCIWHHPMPDAFRTELDAVMGVLGEHGFDPHCGRKLADYAQAAGLRLEREAIEPYHKIVGAPTEAEASQWRHKIRTIKRNYAQLCPENPRAEFFDAFIAFIESDDTMTWSNLHLVQARKPS